jgi:hypothetical protein
MNAPSRNCRFCVTRSSHQAGARRLPRFGILARAIARMPPQAWRLMSDAVHLEGVQPDFFRQRLSPAKRFLRLP